MGHAAIEFDYDGADELLLRFELLRQQEPKIRALDAAQKLGVSEGELLAARVASNEAIRFRDEPQAILEALEQLGVVMALTRNAHCVHERKGVYTNGSFSSHGAMKMGLFVNPDIDLRLFMDHWQYCFAVCEQIDGDVPRKSLQFFDKSGVALHKVYLTPKSNKRAYAELVERFTAVIQSTYIEIEEHQQRPADTPDDRVDWQAFRSAWENLQDTHDFYPMLRKFKVGREQSFRHIGNDFAYQVSLHSARHVLDAACEKGCEIMVFVGNRGCLQIHTGGVKKLKEFGPWYNVLDSQFHFHLREDKITSTWVTKKPTIDGVVTAVEVFDDVGEIIVTFFGKRKPGIPELGLWREIVAALPTQDCASS